MNSILIADCGSTMTTVALVDRVNEHYRFVARGESASTHRPPWEDVRVGLTDAIRQVEALVGRRLLDRNGELMRPQRVSGDGVDELVAVSSAAPPVRLMLVGLTDNLSLSSAQRAVLGSRTTVAGTLAMEEGILTRDQNNGLETLRRVRPEAILVAGGTEDGATQPVLDLAQLVAFYCRCLPEQNRPSIIYAGNGQLKEKVTHLFDPVCKLYVAANVRPGLDEENLEPVRAALERLYRERCLERVPGMSLLDEWTNQPITTASRSFGQVIRYVGERHDLNVMGVDVGSSATVLATQTGHGLAHNNLITHPVPCLFSGESGGATEIQTSQWQRWLPFEKTPVETGDGLLEAGLHPQSLPQTTEDQMLEYALARERIRQAVAVARGDGIEEKTHSFLESSHWDLIVGAGRILTRAPHPGYAALKLLDALEPVGVCKVALDVGNIAGALGALAAFFPLAAVQVVEYDAFQTLGTFVVLTGTAGPGETALNLVVRYRDGSTLPEEVEFGTLKVIPVDVGESVSLEMYPAPGMDVGVGKPGLSVVAEAEGGVLGVVIDARGRPLSLPEDVCWRWQLVRDWLAQLGVHASVETMVPSA